MNLFEFPRCNRKDHVGHEQHAAKHWSQNWGFLIGQYKAVSYISNVEILFDLKFLFCACFVVKFKHIIEVLSTTTNLEFRDAPELHT